MHIRLFGFPETEIDLVVSVLLKDDWFNDIYPDAIERLSGKPKAINHDLNSPTTSVSEQSISYVKSHGSS